MIECEDPRICGVKRHHRKENCKAYQRAKKGAGGGINTASATPPAASASSPEPRMVGIYGESSIVATRHWPEAVPATQPYLEEYGDSTVAFQDDLWTVDVVDDGDIVRLMIEDGGEIEFGDAQSLEDFAAVVASMSAELGQDDDVYSPGEQPGSGVTAPVLDDVVVHEGQEIPVYIQGNWSGDVWDGTGMMGGLSEYTPVPLEAKNLGSLARVAASAAAHLRSLGDDSTVLYHFAVDGGPLYHADSADDARYQHADGTGGGAASVQISFQGRCPNPNEPERC